MQGLSRLLLLLVFICLNSVALVAAPDSRGLVILPPGSHDAGQVQRGQLVTVGYRIHNAGTEPVQITAMQFNVPGLKARVPSSVPPGEVVELTLEWDTRIHSGEFIGEALLQTSLADAEPLRVVLTGTVLSPIEFDPFPAFYVSQFEGASSQQSIEVRINREGALELQAGDQDNELGTMSIETLEPGRRYQVTFTGAPALPVGIHSGSAYLRTDDPERPRLRLEVNVKVKADLHPSAESVDLARLRPAALRANPEMLEFVAGTVTIESRHGKASQLVASVDLDFLEVIAEAGDEDRRLGVELRPVLDKLKAGSYAGTLTVGFPEENAGALKLPVTVDVED